MVRRVKPTHAQLVVSGEPVILGKSARIELANLLINRSKHYPIKRNELHILLKERKRANGEPLSTPSDNEIKNLALELSQVVEQFKETLLINGDDDEINGYIDINDSAVCREFFKNLENAADGYLADLKLDSVRTNKSDLKEELRQLSLCSMSIESELHKLGDAARAFLSSHDLDVDDIIDLMDRLQDSYLQSKELQVSKDDQARTNLCISVAQALNSIGVSATTSQLGLMDEFTKKLVYLVNRTELQDIHKNLRMALIKIRI